MRLMVFRIGTIFRPRQTGFNGLLGGHPALDHGFEIGEEFRAAAQRQAVPLPAQFYIKALWSLPESNLQTISYKVVGSLPTT